MFKLLTCIFCPFLAIPSDTSTYRLFNLDIIEYVLSEFFFIFHFCASVPFDSYCHIFAPAVFAPFATSNTFEEFTFSIV